jgi:hypothetical protein
VDAHRARDHAHHLYACQNTPRKLEQLALSELTNQRQVRVEKVIFR